MPPTPGSDVVIIGGGVIGLAVAHTLAADGASVTVLERDRPGRGATWAAGGMLAPLGEAPGEGPFLSFGLQSLAAWPAWAGILQSASGVDPAYRRCGQLLVAADDGDVASLRRRFAWLSEAGHDVHWLEGDAVGAVEPALGLGWRAGVHLPGHARVDPRRLVEALERAADAAGAIVRTDAPVRGLRSVRGRVEGVELEDGGALPCRAVVVAAGAWSGRLAGLPRSLPVRPVRGQMLALSLDGPVAEGLVAGPGAYLIPRDQEDPPLLVVGASMEEVGFTVDTDGATVARLRAAAEALVPALALRPEHDRWAGLRPATPDDLPILGPEPRLEGLVYATGHHRNGILLAPATAQLVHGALAGRRPEPRWDAFRPDRFEAD